MSDTEERLTEYCLHGGLYNPELMQHDKVRELLIDCRDEIARLRLTDAEREAIVGAADLLIGSKPGATLRNLLERTNHDAVPDARAESDEARTDKAATSHRREGTGNTPSKAEIDAL